MSKIKTREKTGTIKPLNKSAVVGRRMKNAFVRSRKNAAELMDDRQSSPSEYAEDRVRSAVDELAHDTVNVTAPGTRSAVRLGRKLFRRQKEKRLAEKRRETRTSGVESVTTNHERTMDCVSPDSLSVPATPGGGNGSVDSPYGPAKVPDSTERVSDTVKRPVRTIQRTEKPIGRSVHKAVKATVKTAQRAEKTARHGARAAVKTVERTSKTAVKTAQATAKAGQQAAQVTVRTARLAVQAARTAVKAAGAALKMALSAAQKLAAAIAAGGWVAVLIITIICMIGLLACSCFGIFFSGEGGGAGGAMPAAVREINEEYQNTLAAIKVNNPHDVPELSGSRAVWPEVLAVYAVRTASDSDDPQEVATMDDNKKTLLKEIFWAMNEVSSRTDTSTTTQTVETDNGEGNIVEEEVEITITTLHITISHKTAGEMADIYHFTADQRRQLAELLAEENRSLWSAVLYGIGPGDEEIVAVAQSQLGNEGGEPYWSWYGFSSCVEWCACFVSWCADQCGYIDNGVLPKFAGCSFGVQWFQERGFWQDNGYRPRPGDITFYDWDDKGSSGPQDGLADHVGIVEKVEDGRVYTIEGNTSDGCHERSYELGHYEILGFGTPEY